MNILDHVGFIKTLAKQMTSKHELFNELVQVGMLGLLEASKRFDSSRDIKFLSYGGVYAHGKMKQYLRDVVSKHSAQDFDTQYVVEDPKNVETDLIKAEVLEKAEQFLTKYNVEHKKEAFLALYLKNDTIGNVAKKYSISPWTVRQRAEDVRKALITHINQGE